MAQILTGTQVFKVVVESTPAKRMAKDIVTGGISTSKQIDMQSEIDANKNLNDAQTAQINNLATAVSSITTNNEQTAVNTATNAQQNIQIADNTATNQVQNTQIASNTLKNDDQDVQIANNAAMNVTQNTTIASMQNQIVENSEHNDEIEAMDLEINNEGQVEINNVNMDGGVF